MKRVIRKYWALFFFGGFILTLSFNALLNYVQPVIVLAGKPVSLSNMLLLVTITLFAFLAFYALDLADLNDSARPETIKGRKSTGAKFQGNYPNLDYSQRNFRMEELTLDDPHSF